MNLETVRAYLLTKKGAVEETPFGPDVLVFKVVGKMFALLSHKETPLRLNLKCDPDLALTLRSRYAAIQPGYHMNKKHWNSLIFDGTLPTEEIFGLIDHSYELVVQGLKKADRQRIA